MKRILFVSHTAELNGAERWLLETLRRLNREKYRPSLVAPGPGALPEAAAALEIAVHIVPTKWWLTERRQIWRQPLARPWNVRSVRKIADIARGEKSDLVFSNSAATSAGARAARIVNRPHVWAIHEILGGPQPSLRHLFGRRAAVNYILKRSVRVIVNSEASRSAFPPDDHVVLIYNGVDIPTGDERRQRALREALGLKPGARLAGVVGKTYPGKGQREALRAAAGLVSKYPDLTWLIVGTMGDTGYERGLREFVRASGLGERVRFTGYQPDLVNLLSLMDVVVIPSVVESFGRVALEAMAAGVPVVAVRAGGIPEIVVHGQTGFLLDDRDPEKIAQALDGIFQDPARARAVAEEGRKMVREKFSVERQISGIEAVLDGVLGV